MLNRLKKELPASLYYHGPHHTLDVMHAAMQIAEAEKITENEKKLLRIAAAYHDAGFIYLYNGHEEKGCEMANETLPGFGFSNEQLSIICGMIMATKIPQQPKALLEKIIADADLDYLGREDVYPIAKTLFEELKTHSGLANEKEWTDIQISFLKNHHYHTEFSLLHREPAKRLYLNQLQKPG